MKYFVDIIKPGNLETSRLDAFMLRASWLGYHGLLIETQPSSLKSLRKYFKMFRESCLETLVKTRGSLTPGN